MPVAAHDLVLINVVAGTAQAYGVVCGSGLQLISVEKSLELQHQSLALTKRLMADGRAVDLDVTRQRQLVSELEEVIPGLKAAQRNALFQLAVLTGRAPAQYDIDLESCAAPPRLLAALPVEDGAALLKRRPDVREAERLLAAATAEIGVATAELYPDIQIGMAGGSTGVTADALTSPTNFWDTGVTMNWQATQAEFVRIGATSTVNSTDGKATEAIMKMTSGRGVDIAIEAVGVPATFELCEKIVTAGGHIANIGVHGKKVDLHLESLWDRNISITTRLVDTVTIPMLFKTVASHKIDPKLLITHRYKFDHILEAYETFGSAAKTKALKVIIEA
jgi:hypothetical protein